MIDAGNKILANKSELLVIHVDSILIASQHAKPIDKDNISYGSYVILQFDTNVFFTSLY